MGLTRLVFTGGFGMVSVPVNKKFQKVFKKFQKQEQFAKAHINKRLEVFFCCK